MANKSKQHAGRLGGLATVAKHGRDYMATIGRRGAASTWQRYKLVPYGLSGWAMLDRKSLDLKAAWR